jgi:hypothetical protein
MNPQDDFMHPVRDEPAWSESYYFNFCDPRTQVGMFTRMGFRPGDGWADGLHVVYLGGDHLLFTYSRRDLPQVEDDLTVGGLSLERVEPFKRWRVSYEGPAQEVADGAILVTRRRERPEGWFTPAELSMSVDFEALGEPFYSAEGVRGHFEQAGRVHGKIRSGDKVWDVDGYGVRDKSWGPRSWKAADGSGGTGAAPSAPVGPFATWFSANWGAGLAFGGGAGSDGKGNMRGEGWLQRDGKNVRLRELRVLDSTYRPGSILHTRLRLELVPEEGEALPVDCTVVGMCPTKIPQQTGATFVNEALARFDCKGQTGWGIAEYWHAVGDDAS